jgi:pimeloyl-ACP methyl ester carboxylesterase/predicted glycosyltransferase
MRARQPDFDGFVERDGVKVAYEVFGEANEPTVLLMPTWSIVHSRTWKAQVGHLARRYRVIAFDGRGNGRSDRPSTPDAYSDAEFVEDGVAVLDGTGTDHAIVVGLSMGGLWTLLLASRHPERVLGAVVFGAAVPHLRDGETKPADEPQGRPTHPFDTELDEYEGWAKYNRHHWLHDYDDFLQFFFRQVFTEPHSTKQREDAVGWGHDTDGATLVATRDAPPVLADRSEAEAMCRSVQCPLLIVHGTDDGIIPHSNSVRLAELTGATLMSVEGGGHNQFARDPVFANLLVQDFVEKVASRVRAPQHRTWTRALRRSKRALYISSPIGLGHAQRDIAIAAELRKLHPDLQIDWLAQSPVTSVLEARGENVHAASRFLASESAHITDESHEHDLHAFQAVRRMDEILVNNFMVFHDVVSAEPYDLWIGDEAWDLDYFLHENPELKRAPFVWMTDFVGWLPMPDGGAREAAITADYNAEMIEHVARFRRVRDRSIFVGNPSDVVADDFGPGLGPIRSWTEANFDFSGYITGFDPSDFADRDMLRAELGYGPDEKVCIVTVGGSGVGGALLRKVIRAHPSAAQRVPGLRTIAVAGPRIDPAALDPPAGVEIRAFVPDLYKHLAACDLAVVQGGLTTCMELTANRRPFLYFPLAHHFEQNFHVRHRLDRHGAGRCMDFATTNEDEIAAAIAAELATDRGASYAPVETDGAVRAAALIGELL